MKDKLFSFAISFSVTLVMIATIVPILTLTVHAATAPTKMWVEASDTNGIPVQIDIFVTATGDTATNKGQLYLPGNADTESCFLSWDGDVQATVDGIVYDSGECPIPSVNTEKTYYFNEGEQTLCSFEITTYQGSENVQTVFIDIDETKGTIAAMDNDINHDTSCTGDIYINGQNYVMKQIKGRGNSSWKLAEDKRPYNISLEEKIIFPGIDSGKTKKWSFLAEIIDHSLLCNRTGFYLAHEIGVGQDTTSADVWMNGEYQGCYTVTPKYDSFVSDNGYLIEEDNYRETASVEEGGDPQFELEGLSITGSARDLITVKKIGNNLLIQDGVVDESAANKESVANDIRLWLQDAWGAIRSDTGYNSKGKHYTEYIDIESFAKMYLMQEYVKSYDVCAGSVLFHRDGLSDEDKLFAGPIWDLDNAMGSTQVGKHLGQAADRRSGSGEFLTLISDNRSSLYRALGRHEDFMEEVKNQYVIHRSSFNDLETKANEMIDEIEKSAVMNHIKVNEISCNVHKYNSDVTFDCGTDYEQSFLATTDSKTDWLNYAANLKTYVRARSLWFYNTYVKGHDYTAVVTQPTCTAKGYTTYTCSECGYRYTCDETNAKGHKCTAVVTQPTCTSKGYTTYTCSECGYIYTSDETEKTAHKLKHFDTSGFLKKGEEYDKCTVCGTLFNKKIAYGYSTYYVKGLKAVKAKKAIIVKWKKQSKAKRKKFNGYQIRYSTSSDMSGAKYVRASKNSKSKKIKNLKTKKRYYVQVRTYTKSGVTTFYSKWSAKKSVKTK